jgi:hypothetical protein
MLTAHLIRTWWMGPAYPTLAMELSHSLMANESQRRAIPIIGVKYAKRLGPKLSRVATFQEWLYLDSGQINSIARSSSRLAIHFPEKHTLQPRA